MNALELGICSIAAVLFVSGSVYAQQAPEQRTVAKLKDLEGTVLVSQGDAMAAGAKDQRLKPDTRIVTTAGSKVTINYDKGCNVHLEENQRFTVREFGECAALIAGVETIGVGGAVVGVGAGAAAAGGATAGISGLAILGAVGVGGAVIYGVSQTGGKNVSPN